MTLAPEDAARAKAKGQEPPRRMNADFEVLHPNPPGTYYIGP